MIEYLLCHLFDQVDQADPDHLFLLSYPQVLKTEINSLLNRISIHTEIAYLQDRAHHPILEHLQDPWDQLDPNYIRHIVYTNASAPIDFIELT